MLWFIKIPIHQFEIFLNFIEKQADGDVSSAIRNSLSASLNNGTHNGLNSLSGESTSLQSQLAASSKLALISPVDYEEVNHFTNSVQDLKSKYIVLKPQTSSNASATITSNSTNTNGKALVNGSTTDKTSNGTGNLHSDNHQRWFSILFINSTEFFFVLHIIASVLCCALIRSHALSSFSAILKKIEVCDCFDNFIVFASSGWACDFLRANFISVFSVLRLDQWFAVMNIYFHLLLSDIYRLLTRIDSKPIFCV